MIINMWWFYLIDVFDNLESIAIVILFLGTIVGIVGGSCIEFEYGYCDDDDKKSINKLVKRFIIAMCICCGITALTPSKEQCTQ